MREMTASEASRNFSAVLDAAEHGETIVVTRAGHRVALIAPAHRANAPGFLDVLAQWQNNPALDATFAEHIEQASEAASAEADTDPWLD